MTSIAYRPDSDLSMIGNKRQSPHSREGLGAESKKIKPNGKTEIIKGAWSPEEDQKMIEAVKTYGTDWKSISAYVTGRTAKQCRDRYKLKLDPSINHGPWTPEEDSALLKFHEQLGRQWTKIAKLMPGRTENSVKSRYASLLRSKTKEWTEQEDALMRSLRDRQVPFEEIAAVHLPHRSEHAVKKRWERLFMRDLAKKIRSEMPTLSNPDEKKNVDPNMPRLNPTLAAATSSSSPKSSSSSIRINPKLAASTPRLNIAAPAAAPSLRSVNMKNESEPAQSVNMYTTPNLNVGVMNVKSEAEPSLPTTTMYGINTLLQAEQHLAEQSRIPTSFSTTQGFGVPLTPLVEAKQVETDPLVPAGPQFADNAFNPSASSDPLSLTKSPDQLTQDRINRNKRASRFKRHSTSTTVMMQLIGEPLQ